MSKIYFALVGFAGRPLQRRRLSPGRRSSASSNLINRQAVLNGGGSSGCAPQVLPLPGEVTTRRTKVNRGHPPVVPPVGVVKLPPVPQQYRSASPFELVSAVTQLGGTNTDTVEKWLLEVGPPAAAMLAALEPSAPPAKRALLRAVRDRIDLAEALRPRKLGLKFEGTPLPDAIRALSQAGGVPLIYNGKSNVKVTLDLSEETFWPAVKRLCAATDLIFTQYGDGRLIDGKPPSAAWSAGFGPVYVVAASMSQSNTFNLTGGQERPFTAAQLNLAVFLDTQSSVIGIGYPRLSAFTAPTNTIPSILRHSKPHPTSPTQDVSVYRTLFLNLPAKTEGSLKRLKYLAFEVEVRRRDKPVVEGLEAQGARQSRSGGGRLDGPDETIPVYQCGVSDSRTLILTRGDTPSKSWTTTVSATTGNDQPAAPTRAIRLGVSAEWPSSGELGVAGSPPIAKPPRSCRPDPPANSCHWSQKSACSL